MIGWWVKWLLNKSNICLRYNEGELKTDIEREICERAIEMLT